MKRNKSAAEMPNNRSAVNLTSVIVTAVLLSVAIVTADVTFTTRIKDISKDLGKALNTILQENEMVYTNYTDESVYLSNVDFHPKGMAGLYNITHIFMDFIQPKELFPKDVAITDANGVFQPGKLAEHWPELLRHYAGLLALTLIGLLFAVLMPLAGFCFCCCRCCGRCGARSQPFDKKHDMCRKVLLAMFLIAIATLLLFGVVCAFVSNQHMQEGVEELPTNLDNSVKDVQTYINSTNSHMGVLLVKNYQELNKLLSNILNKSGEVIADRLKELSNAISFSRLETFVTGLNDVKKNLILMEASTRNLRIKASQLNDGLRRVKHELLETLKNCDGAGYSACNEINNEVGKLGTTVDFDSLPDVSAEVTLLNNSINDQLIIDIQNGNKEFKELPKMIQKTIDEDLNPEIERALKQTGETLEKAYKDMGKLLTDVDKTIGDNSDEHLKQVDYYIKQYSIYRYYVGIFVSSLLLLVIVCVTLGLMCGICGKRPDGYDDDCCNKGAGSKFLMLGVAVMFLFSIVLMAITLLYFLSGVVVQRLVCDTLRNNNTEQENEVFKYLDNILNTKDVIHSDLQTVINSCHANKSAYNVLRLDYMFNVSNIPNMEDTKLNQKLDEFVKNITFNKTYEILNETTKGNINTLKNSALANLPISRFETIMDHDLTSINLTELANDLAKVRKKLEKNGPESETYVMSIKQNEMYLQMYQTNLVDPMVTIANDLKDKAKAIDESLRFGEDNFTIAVEKTIDEVEKAQDVIKVHGTELLRNITEEFGVNFMSKIDSFLKRIIGATENDIGQCGPLSNVYNQTLVATCDKILNPWNGFWISVGWCLVLFIPTIVLSVKLSTLYQKSDPYPGPLVEHEYLYDAYADRDNIPLSNSSNSKKGKKKKKGRSGGGGGGEMSVYQQQASGSGAEARSRDAPGGSSHPDTRYADMAPKHWEDYPNGGPPQYQSAPLATEYERPPPYYYPGPGDRP